jgi:periplasmic protein TonB
MSTIARSRANGATRSRSTSRLGAGFPYPAAQAESVCRELNESVWQHWNAAQVGAAAGARDIAWDAVHRVAGETVLGMIRKRAEADAGRGFTTIRNLDTDPEVLRQDDRVLHYPVILIDYHFAGKTYAFAYDAWRGTALGGARPVDVKKVGLWSAVGLSAAAAIGGLVYVNVPATTALPAPAAAEAANAATSDADTLADAAPAPQPLAAEDGTPMTPAAGAEDVPAPAPRSVEEAPAPAPTDSLAAAEAPPMPVDAPAELKTRQWITPDDYPAAALRREAQGRVAVAFDVSAAGVPTACNITASSGDDDLDAATCRLGMRRLRFTPEIRGGEAVAHRYARSIRWTVQG